MNFFRVTLNGGYITNDGGLKVKLPEGRNKILVEKVMKENN